MKMNVADLILKHLEQEGVEYIFGITGAALNPFLAAFNRNPRIKPILTKHEGGAAFMADGYARIKGALGACFATSGPGATNLVTGGRHSLHRQYSHRGSYRAGLHDRLRQGDVSGFHAGRSGFGGHFQPHYQV